MTILVIPTVMEGSLDKFEIEKITIKSVNIEDVLLAF